MTEVRDSKPVWKAKVDTTGKKLLLSGNLEQILLCVKDGINHVKTIQEELDLKTSTLYYRINSLIKRGYLYWKTLKQPKMLDLTIPGFDYFENNFPKSLDRVDLDGFLENCVRVEKKSNHKPLIDFELSKIPELFDKYVQKIKKNPKLKGKYPPNPLLLIRAHKIQYNFPIVQQSKYLTYECAKNRYGVLARKVWTTTLGDKTQFKANKKIKGWTPYNGEIFYQNTRFKIMFTKERVMVCFYVNFHVHPIDSAFEILDKLFWIKKELETIFTYNNTKFILGNPNPYYVSTQTSAHYGIQLEPLAVIANELGICLEDKGGRLRIDASNEIPELEGIHSTFGIDDVIFLFTEMVWKIRNRYSLKDAKLEIDNLTDSVELLELDFETHKVKTENQYLTLQDQLTLTNQRIKTNEEVHVRTEKDLSELTRLVRDSKLQEIDHYERLEEDLTNIEIQLEASRFIKRHITEQAILKFLRLHEREIGYTRKQLTALLEKPEGSINRYVTDLVKEGVIIDQKEGNEAGRVFLNPTHLFYQFNLFNKGDSKI